MLKISIHTSILDNKVISYEVRLLEHYLHVNKVIYWMPATLNFHLLNPQAGKNVGIIFQIVDVIKVCTTSAMVHNLHQKSKPVEFCVDASSTHHQYQQTGGPTLKLA